MRYFSKDHPRCRSPQGVMSCDEIRYWIVALREQHGWGRMALSRYLGCHNDGAMVSKLRGSWIMPGEQQRWSKLIDRILSGEVIMVKRGKRTDAVIATHPVPLRTQPRMAFVNGRLGFVSRPITARKPSIPSFESTLGG